MTKHSDRFGARVLTAWSLLLGVVVLLGIGFLRSETESNRSYKFSGEWRVTGNDGGDRGVVTFLADGRFDDGEYVGEWSLRGDEIHLDLRESRPTSALRYVFPTVEKVALSVVESQSELSLRGNSAFLTRADESKE